ncbi:MAG: adenosylcobinamide-GDP ribazoletransferase [Pseudomonadota bacterium]
MSRLAQDGRAFLTAVQFLTRLPVPDPGWEDGQLRRALAWFPAVGAGIGAVGGGVYWASAPILPPALAAGLALGAIIWLTGALHEDGLADTADGLGGHWDADRALEIMRDSRLGSYGAVALILSLGLRWTALASIAAGNAPLALVLAASLGRFAMVAGAAGLPPARPGGLGAMLGSGPGAGGLAIAAAVPLALAGALGLAGVAALLLGALTAATLGWLLRRRLGGHTGDGLGALGSVAETAALIALAGALA